MTVTQLHTSTIDALHDVHTATNDVLKGYREMAKRAEPEIQPVIERLCTMHQQHAGELAAALQRLRESTADDTSLQGSVNKAVVILRDWLSGLDRDVLPAVRQGEESLRDGYDDALDALPDHPDMAVVALLQRQRDGIRHEIARLPKA